MGEARRILTTGVIAKETGLSRQRVWQLATAGLIPATRAKEKQHRFYDSKEFAAWRKERAAHRATVPAIATRARRISQRRRQRAEKLFQIAEEKTRVSPVEKALACSYISILAMLWKRKFFGDLVAAIPLLEGIESIHQSKIFSLDEKGAEMLDGLAKMIRELPTRVAPSRPRSSAVSDRSRTKQ